MTTLSLTNRRRVETSSTWATRRQSSIAVPTAYHLQQQQQQQQLRMRKQHSFIETTVKTNFLSSRRSSGFMVDRGLSVDRSYESVRQKLAASIGRPTNANNCVQKKAYSGFENQHSSLRLSKENRPSGPKPVSSEILSKERAFGTLTCNEIPHRSYADVLEDNRQNCKNNLLNNFVDDTSTESSLPAKADTNKINLNIVLSQTIKAITDIETVHSDIDSSSEGAEVLVTKCTPNSKNSSSAGTNNALALANATQRRRAQFVASRNTTTNATIAAAPANVTAPTIPTPLSITLNDSLTTSPSTIVPRRPPLVRAMSAPVRSFDESSKSVIANNKRKLRRRKLVSRNGDCGKIDNLPADNKDLIFETEINGNDKKTLSRSRSVLAVDVITLVSLVSSEGSDSEKEDTSTTTTETNSERSGPAGRAPSLKKTGKSETFARSFPLAPKDYSQIIRRGSIAPLAARIRANRPPSAPPVSIFLSETKNADANGASMNEKPTVEAAQQNQSPPKLVNGAEATGKEGGKNVSTEYEFPEHVRGIKERECWKLYQKMFTKGINVTYDTILRGMLTPTEFRQIQKQRELDEIKAREAEEALKEEENSKPTTAVQRLSETLLKK